jgi:hypothetical protein
LHISSGGFIGCGEKLSSVRLVFLPQNISETNQPSHLCRQPSEFLNVLGESLNPNEVLEPLPLASMDLLVAVRVGVF